jgi:phospholipase/carboxylesterase
MPTPLEIALPQGPEPYRGGWQWFDWPEGMSDEAFAAVVGASEEKLWPALVEAAHGRKLIVAGHSQGAVLAYVIAARHPEILEVLPISGVCPRLLLPRAHEPTAPVYALHGDEDDVISIDAARSSIDAFRAAGGPAELQEFPGAGHTVTDEMRLDLFAHIAQAVGARPAR